MKIYVSQFALTEGILEFDVTDKDKYGKYYSVRANIDGRNIGFTIKESEAFATKEQAIERAELMRSRKIQSLTKKIDLLTSLTF